MSRQIGTRWVAFLAVAISTSALIGVACNSIAGLDDPLPPNGGTTSGTTCADGTAPPCKPQDENCSSQTTTCQPFTRVSGMCTAAQPAGTGMPCTEGGGIVCDGMGKCVECVADDNCVSSTQVEPRCDASTSKCVSCSNGVQDSDEDGKDCGNACSARCDGAACMADADCKSGVCAAGQCKLKNDDDACTADEQCGSLLCDQSAGGGTGKCIACAAGSCGATQCNTGTSVCKAPLGAPCLTAADCNDPSAACNNDPIIGTWLCGKSTGTCTGGSDCSSGYCNASGHCISCSTDANCGADGQCDLMTGICTLASGALCNPSAPNPNCTLGKSCQGFPATCQ